MIDFVQHGETVLELVARIWWHLERNHFGVWKKIFFLGKVRGFYEKNIKSVLVGNGTRSHVTHVTHVTQKICSGERQASEPCNPSGVFIAHLWWHFMRTNYAFSQRSSSYYSFNVTSLVYWEIEYSEPDVGKRVCSVNQISLPNTGTSDLYEKTILKLHLCKIWRFYSST